MIIVIYKFLFFANWSMAENKNAKDNAEYIENKNRISKYDNYKAQS